LFPSGAEIIAKMAPTRMVKVNLPLTIDAGRLKRLHAAAIPNDRYCDDQYYPIHYINGGQKH
jgi:hypothetical protein